jgi:hypothetical protein
MLERDGDTRIDRAREAISAGADQVKEFTRDVASSTRDTAKRAVRIVKEAEPDPELRERARSGTERSLSRAGDAVGGAAPAVGRGAEYAVRKVGSVLRFVARPVAVIVGSIAGVVGGWWQKASELRSDLPGEEEQACRTHFATLTVHGLTFDDARSGYAIGYIAGCNPEYSGRAFEDVEADLRHGFLDADAEYDALREFARFGYGRGAATRT